MIPPVLLGPILSIGEKLIDQLFPDKEKADRAKLIFAQEAAKMEQEEVKEFHDFIVAYEGSGDKAHPLLQLLRGSVRPVLTYVLAGAYLYGFANPADYPPGTMDGLFQLNLISLGFWYSERVLKNLGLNLGSFGRAGKQTDDRAISL